MPLEAVVHPFAPLLGPGARVLVLGTMPSAASRADGFYYGHPRNRFWPLMAALFGGPVPLTRADKAALLTINGVALWDVLAACRIEGSSDASIRAPRANDFAPLLAAHPGLKLFANGQTAAGLYERLVRPVVGVPITPLPSTSPANAAWTPTRLLDAWDVLRRN
ncbi:MAG: DNA-deoxyinosine glycosylase [Oscillospiraceae bacterium]|nr:DNA-deoxyinosine glycosylase [Oscillospiraceae bacterium]